MTSLQDGDRLWNRYDQVVHTDERQDDGYCGRSMRWLLPKTTIRLWNRSEQVVHTREIQDGGY